MSAVPVVRALAVLCVLWPRARRGVEVGVVGPQVTGEADGEPVVRAEDLDAGMT